MKKIKNPISILRTALLALGCFLMGTNFVIAGDCDLLLSAPIATTPQKFCEAANVADLRATGVGVLWYKNETDLIPMSNTEALKDGATYWAESNTAGCTSTMRTLVKVNIGSFMPNKPAIPTPQSLCGPATLQDIVTDDAGSVVWYDAAQNVLPLTTSLVDGRTYYYAVSGAGNKCPGADLYGVFVFVNNESIPLGAPELEKYALFCPGTTLASIPVPNKQILWYYMKGTAPLNPATILTDGVYYATQRGGRCQSDDSTAVLISIGIGASAPEIPFVQPLLCKGSTLADLTITGSAIVWYNAQNGDAQLPATTVLEDGVTYWAAQRSGSCVSERIPVAANVLLCFSGLSNETQTSTISIYPTILAEGEEITVSGIDMADYTIYTQTGIVVKAGITKTGKINVNGLAAGVYILSVEGKTAKFIKVVLAHP